MARLKKSEAQVKTDEGQVALFRAQIRKVSGPQQQAFQQQLEVLEAQLALDQDGLQDAKQDLTRAGGDMAGSIQRLWEKHRAEAQEHGSKDPSIDTAANSAEAGYDAGNLIAQVAAWYALSRKTPLLMRAREEVLADTAALMYKHDTLEAVATSLSAQIPPQKNSQGAGFPLVRG